MASFTDKTPPPFDKNVDNFVKWKKKLSLWKKVTDVADVKQGSLIILRLDDDTQDQVLELVSEEDIGSAEGAKKVLDALDGLFKVEESVTTYETYEEFENYKRPVGVSMKEYCSEFQRKVKKVEATGTKLADVVLAYRLLKSANLDESEIRLLKATTDKMTYADMTKQLKWVFNSEDNKAVSSSGVRIKEEPTRVRIKEEPTDIVELDTMYGGSYRRYDKGKRSDNIGRDMKKDDYSHEEKRGVYKKKRGKNPLDKYGNVTRCLECDSVNHYVKDCPDVVKKSHKTYHEDHNQLSDSDSEDDHSRNTAGTEYIIDQCAVVNDTYEDVTKITLTCDSLNTALLDCGAPKTVCGKKWLNEYLSTLSQDDRKAVKYSKSKNMYRFGCGNKLPALEHVGIPAMIGESKVIIGTDVVEGDIPLLFSRESMKKCGSNLNFREDTLEILGQKLNLVVTDSGHYALPLGRNKQVMVDVAREDIKVTLLVENDDPMKVAFKLHRMFAHPSADRLINLVKNQGKECSDLVTAIKEVSKKCKICAVYRKPPPRPVVGFPMATRFNQCVAMDLKTFRTGYLLHMICTATRLTGGAFIRNKSPETVIHGIMTHWLSIFGTPEVILSDNGGEFCNESMIELAEKFNLNLKTTAAESPWSNGLVERHNQIMGEMITKTQEDTGCTLDMAIMWSVAAHNSLTNVHGFTPFQLVFGRNPVLPSLQSDRPPALSEESTSDMVRKNLNCIHAARQAHIRSESCEKVRRALRHNIRTSGEVKYVTGDKVYFKRADSKRWRGPAVVLGQDGQQVLVKYQGNYVRVHPCRVSLVSDTIIGLSNEKNEHHNTRREEHTSVTDASSTEKRQTRSMTYKDSSEGITVGSEASNNYIDDQQIEMDEQDNIDVSTVDNPHLADEPENEENQTGEPEELDSVEICSSDSDKEEHDSVVINSSDSEKEDEDAETDASKELKRGTETEVEESEGGEEQKKKRGRPKKKKTGEIDLAKKITLKPGVIVRYRTNLDSPWKVTTLERRGGKATSDTHKYCWNTINSLGQREVISFDKDVSEYEIVTDLVCSTIESDCPVEMKVTPTYIAHKSEEREKAMIKELDSWKENKVYTEVDNNNQHCISGRWIVKPKVIDGRQSLKARYVLRGYEEEKDFRADSPTCMRSSVRLLLAVIASSGWTLNSIDFKTAFLQGDPIERDIYMRPPKQAQTNKLWKLNKTVYGLNDAPRQWYLRLKKTIVELGCVLSTLDSGLFFVHGEGLEGIIVIFVDDILWGGTDKFQKKVIVKLKSSLNVGSEQSEAFKYVGILMKQEEDRSIRISQGSYVESMKTIDISEERMNQKDEKLSPEERTKLRSVMGQINWVSNITRPDIGFSAGQISMSGSKATVSDMIAANKLVRNIKETQSSILFPKMNLKKAYLKVYTDASYANLVGGASQGGHVVLLTDGDRTCPLTWRSAKVKRIVKSTIAAETLALLDGLESAYLLSKIIAEVIYHGEVEAIPVVGITDNRNLADSAYSSSLIEDKRLLIEMNIIRQMINREEAQVEWIQSGDQVSDVLTKVGVSGSKLREVVSRGSL